MNITEAIKTVLETPQYEHYDRDGKVIGVLISVAWYEASMQVARELSRLSRSLCRDPFLLADVIELLESCRREHSDGMGDYGSPQQCQSLCQVLPGPCDCGAAENNAAIDALLARLQGEVCSDSVDIQNPKECVLVTENGTTHLSGELREQLVAMSKTPVESRAKWLSGTHQT